MIVFQNSGVLDIQALKTFGVSVKETDNPFGYFGTGLKYAIAILLRHEQKITVHAGLKVYKFGLKKTSIRGEDFNIVIMNGNELGFTSQLGKNWELWMAYRELWCNTKDEGGKVFEGVYLPNHRHTSILVEGTEFAQIHANRSAFILESQPIEVFEFGEIHHGESNSIFYHGIKVGEPGPRSDSISLYTYNLTQAITLTEDRTIRWSFITAEYIARAIMGSESETFLRRALTAPEGCSEAEVNLCASGCPPPNDTFISVMTQLTKSFAPQINKSAKELFRKYAADKCPPAYANLTIVEQKQLSKAIAFVESIGFPVSDYKITVLENLGRGIMGRAENKTIKLSRYAFDLGGTKAVAGTLIEEFLHLRYNFLDCSRELQDFLLTKVVSMGEEINEEPL